MKNNTKVFEKKPPGFTPRVQVAATYVQLNDTFLLLQLAPFKSEGGAWGVPAGKLEAGEEPEAGAKRELYEETGLILEQGCLFTSIGELYIRKPDLDYIYHLFHIKLSTLPSISLSEEHISFIWTTREEAEKLPLMNGAIEALDFFLKKKVDS